jgi:hypothetical protein
MNDQEHFACPNCGLPVAKTDKFCKNCGKDLTRISESLSKQPEQPVPPPPLPEAVYERKYSVFQRFVKVLVSPSEAMKDIGLAPDYGGPVVLVALRIVIVAVAIGLAFSKIRWIGDAALISQVMGILSGVVTIAVFVGILLYIAFWLVKSYLVKIICSSGSDWSFGTSASVTGYAYLPEIIFGFVGLLVVYWLIPSVTFNVSDLDSTRRALADYQANVFWIRLVFSIPLSLIGMVWKSWLGGLGTKFGTGERSSTVFGFFVFLGLSLLGWLVSFLVRGTV